MSDVVSGASRSPASFGASGAERASDLSVPWFHPLRDSTLAGQVDLLAEPGTRALSGQPLQGARTETGAGGSALAAGLQGLSAYRGQLYLDGLPVNDSALQTLVRRPAMTLDQLVSTVEQPCALTTALELDAASSRVSERLVGAVEDRLWDTLSEGLRDDAVHALDSTRTAVAHLASDEDACRQQLAAIAARGYGATELDRAMAALGVPPGARGSVVVNLQQFNRDPAALGAFAAGEHPAAATIVRTVQRGLSQTAEAFGEQQEALETGRMSSRELWTDPRFAALREARVTELAQRYGESERLPELLDERLRAYSGRRTRSAFGEGGASLALGAVLPPAGSAAISVARMAARVPGQLASIRSADLYEQAGLAEQGARAAAEAEFEGGVLGTIVDVALAGIPGTGGIIAGAANEAAGYVGVWSELAAAVD